MFAICGSGFGLYGYLPALVSRGEKVVLPNAYANRFRLRPELAQFEAHITWATDIERALDLSEGVVLAVPPLQQTHLLENCLARKNINRIVLEKPLAATPAEAESSFSRLLHSQKRFEIGYSFLYTSWFPTLCKERKEYGSISIDWRFMAHHFAHNVSTWKKRHSQGGGVLRFYGIHLLAVLAHFGYDQIESSSISEGNYDEPRVWDCVASSAHLPSCRIHVDSRSALSKFSVSSNEVSPKIDLGEPFMLEKPTGLLDVRTPALVNLLSRLESKNAELNDTYYRANQLWENAEKKTNISTLGV